MVKVELKDVTKFYGKIRGVENIDLSIDDGEYLAVLGVTGAGKTTTLYSILQQIDSLERNVLTIEDPIEYVHPHKKCLVNQMQYHNRM